MVRFQARTLASVVVFASWAGMAAYAQAQTQVEKAEKAESQREFSTGLIEDIVVTATRRSESLSTVPISIAAVSQESIDQRGIRDMGDLARSTPSLQFRQGNQGSNYIAIRGVTSLVGASTTGIYIDETPIQARAMGAGNATATAFPVLFDLERVEVLRGPQGTLFGSGSQGGTVRFILPSPSLTHFSGGARAEVGLTKGGSASYEAAGAVGGPILEDKLGFRVSAYYRHDGGWVDRRPISGRNDSEDNINTRGSLSLRGALALQATDSLLITPSVFYQKIKIDGSNDFWNILSDPNEGRFVTGTQVGDYGSDRFVLPSLKIEADLGSVALTSATSYFTRDQFLSTDYTAFTTATFTPGIRRLFVPSMPDFFSVAEFGQKQRSFTQEVRLQSTAPDARLNWVVGAFYQHAKQTVTQRNTAENFAQAVKALTGGTMLQVFGRDVLPGNTVYTASDDSLDEQIAAFGQLDYKVVDWLTLTAGLRVARMRFDFVNKQDGPINAPLPTGANGAQSETPITPKFGISIKPDDESLYYATVSKGVRPGGANAAISAVTCGAELAAIGFTESPGQFKADSVWSYEVGAKKSLLDRKVRIATSAYYIDWKDIQQRVGLGCGFVFTANLGAATSKGFDLQLDVNPVRGLTLSATVAYADTKYSETAYGGVIGSTGKRAIIVSKGDLLNTVPWSFTLNGSYEHDIGDDMTGYVRADYNYYSSYHPGGGPGSANYDARVAEIPQVTNLNMRLGLRRDEFDVSLFANNLLNSSDITRQALLTTGAPMIRYNTLRPRTLGATVSYRF
ncbi:TonB-dependent receptor [Govanella unica]|uniref:TonB-dependent receptor n=1 Tax=Govanella unica TaxID=2975056 RepID=A0A9X3TZU3_9PROT|nr:TonB-dependent receptor [Govania unica]MDA5195005.1 TonB-dependent receptor [Govania unica]